MSIFYQSSLPRAGSTLLQNIFAQNPDFYCTPTNDLLELVYSARQAFSSSTSFKAQDRAIVEPGFLGFCRDGITGYYNAITDRKYIIDKSRGWGIHFDLLKEIFDVKPKILCMIRDPRAIISSMETLHRGSVLSDNGFIGHVEMKNTTLHKRVNTWTSGPPVGMAFERLTEIINKKFIDDIHIIKYEELVVNPKEIINKAYEYLDVPSYNHDFNNVEQVTIEDDAVHGTSGLHDIRPSVEPDKDDYYDVLGKTICDDIVNYYKWFYDYFKYEV